MARPARCCKKGLADRVVVLKVRFNHHSLSPRVLLQALRDGHVRAATLNIVNDGNRILGPVSLGNHAGDVVQGLRCGHVYLVGLA